MIVVVLNGSPKGDRSVTLQYVRYLQKIHPEHDYRIFPVARQIGKLERDQRAFDAVMDQVADAAAVIWSFPLYYCLVCSQYKRFIELIFANGRRDVFRGKYALALSTSIHFFDHTAHNYLQGICDDLGMNYFGHYSAEMYDLVRTGERERFLKCCENFLAAAAAGIPTAPRYPPLRPGSFVYEPTSPRGDIDPEGRKVLLLYDEERPGANLQKMIHAFAANFSGGVEVIALTDVDIKGGCLGCCRCGLDNVCQYEGQDGYREFYDEKVKKADIIIMAGEIRDRYLSSRWKLFFDRSFFNTHAPTLKGKQLAWIISGPLGQLPNLMEILSAYGQLQQANTVGIVTDEVADSPQLDALLGELARRSVRLARQGYVAPGDYLGVGGMKIFRDEVWGRLRFVFQADHRHYKRHGFYDFPQKDFKTRGVNLLMCTMTKFPPFRKRFLEALEKEMVRPLKKVVADK
ncbi:MAG: NAD(P)H-dependent oxidoreductase [Pseudomonadota bacterium]|nr:NAD(P)H-dependent oxidoreductase [Pseudomonadota bacterium]